MANKTLLFGSQSLAPDDQVLYVEISPGVYALATASVIISGALGGATPEGPVINIEPALTDEITGATVVISTAQHEVHEGETFRFWYVVPHGTQLANDATIDVVMTTGSLYPHIVFSASGGGDFEFQIFRGPTFLGDGTAFVPHNLKDTSNTVSTVSVSINPTINAPGTEIDGEFAPGGTGGNAGGGAIREDTEDIWRLNTSYLIRITNRSGATNQFGIEGQWHEEATD